jgi:hypothetical protein
MEMSGQLHAPSALHPAEHSTLNWRAVYQLNYPVARIVNTAESYDYRCRLLCQFLCRELFSLSAGTHSPLWSRADRKAVALNCWVPRAFPCLIHANSPKHHQHLPNKKLHCSFFISRVWWCLYLAAFSDPKLWPIQGVTGGMCHTSGGCSLC